MGNWLIFFGILGGAVALAVLLDRWQHGEWVWQIDDEDGR